MVNQIIQSNHSTTAILVTEIRGHCRKASQLRVAFIAKPIRGAMWHQYVLLEKSRKFVVF